MATKAERDANRAAAAAEQTTAQAARDERLAARKAAAVAMFPIARVATPSGPVSGRRRVVRPEIDLAEVAKARRDALKNEEPREARPRISGGLASKIAEQKKTASDREAARVARKKEFFEQQVAEARAERAEREKAAARAAAETGPK